MRFLVDENLPVDVAEVLQEAEHDVVFVPRSEHRGASDQELWRLAVSEERILVTRDLDFPLSDRPPPPGLILVRVPDTFTRRAIRGVFAEFVAGEALAEVAGSITVVSPGRIRARKL